MNKLLIALYLAVIVAANIVTASIPPIPLGALIVPAGSFLIGVTFILRDLVQNAIGRKNTYITIGAAMLISAVSSFILGDVLWIVFASTLTFLASETTDTEIYSRLKLPLAYRMLYSGVVGGLIDSVLFVLIGLSPLFSGILPWGAVGFAILGQITVKMGIQLLGAAVVWLYTGSTGRKRAIRS
jgi:queuosine precursor transporter